LVNNIKNIFIIAVNCNNRPNNTNHIRKQIDDHHSVEDIGITLGQAFAKAAGDKAGFTRYGHAYVPLDEALRG
jgi:imidazoleglycerol phosphate dehydratase HisB